IFQNDNSGFTGPITVEQGILRISNAKALGDSSNGTTVLTNAQLQVADNTGTIVEPLTLNGPGITNDGPLLNLAAPTTSPGPIALARDASRGASAGSLNINAPIGDTGSGHGVSKEGPGQVIFSKADSYRGLTTVNNGILTIRDPLALGTSGTAANGTLVNSTASTAGTLQIEDPTGVGFTVVNEFLTLNGPGVDIGTPTAPNRIGALDNLNGNNTS